MPEGFPWSKTIDTPALVLDAAALEANIAKMAALCSEIGVGLRPHVKTHKSPHIAQRQVAAGAIGLTCQTLGEAEVMAAAGLDRLLISNQIVGELKMRRLTALARDREVIVAVDDPHNVSELSQAAVQAGVEIGVLVEIDGGMGRCGVSSAAEALQLARLTEASPGLKFRGLMGYEGHAVLHPQPEVKKERALRSLSLLVRIARYIEDAQLPVEIVSSSGTGTADIGGTFPGITEIQAGSYATMDGLYAQQGAPYICALTVLATVISTPRPGVAIINAGMKSISTDAGVPQVLDLPEVTVERLSEEHGKLVGPGTARLVPGDRVRLLPQHGCTTINLHSRYEVIQGGEHIGTWPISARGMSA